MKRFKNKCTKEKNIYWRGKYF